jgi:hypothetical protein
MHANTRRAERTPSRIYACFFNFRFLIHPQDAVNLRTVLYASAYAAIRDAVCGCCGGGGLVEQGFCRQSRRGVRGMLDESKDTARVIDGRSIGTPTLSNNL